MSGNGDERSNESGAREANEELTKDTLRASWLIDAGGGSGLKI